MPRQIATSTAIALTQPVVRPVILVDLTINNQTLHIWSGVGTFNTMGNAYAGVGDLGTVTPAQEGVDVEAQGASLTLSGVDPALLTDALSDIQLGAPCTIWLGVVDANCNLIGPPVVLFAGVVDAPTVEIDQDHALIAVPLESRLAILGSGQQRRYTRAEQALTHPDDTAFNWVEMLNDIALRWGM